ncbi:C40 family peptidase [Planococcus salinarum]|uniref:C40 family peptidase n=1 Tax=Planococcus salinarum TaxID=622695 RepID=UPI000E3DB3A0|nr:SH3 domain-containing C40 family peptidase [Planococcus salinarum]TAA72875.1 peptidoglycan endopeptidase [Planococcus salinarum]
MRKLFFTLFASTLIFTGTVTTAGAHTPTPAPATESVQQVSSSLASAKSGTFVAKYNSNIRSDAGIQNKRLFTVSKGTKVTATHQKKYGSQTWFKVNANGKSGWVLSSLLSQSTVKVSAPAASTASSSALVATAMSLRGVPYKFGGTTTAGFDCSGFTQYVFKKNGKNLTRTTLTQFAETDKVTTPKVGDLVFFANTYRPGISHVGIYIGNNQFVHSGGAKAEVRSLSDSYWGPKFHSFRR